MSNNFSPFSNTMNPHIQQVKYDYDPVVIKPPDRNVTHGTITKQIVIDSRDRDYLKYPDSNRYRVEITEEFRDVTSLELILAQIPNTFYNIAQENNKFYISEENDPIQIIDIPIGQYNNQQLLNILNGSKGNLLENLKNNYHFSRNVNNLKIRIQSNNLYSDSFVYNLNYEYNNECAPCKIQSIDKTIGFLNTTYKSNIIDLNFINVSAGNIVGITKISENDYKLYKLKASSSSAIDLDFRKIFEIGDYFILNDATNISCRIYEIKNDNTILFELLNGSDPTTFSGNIFKNISIIESPNIYQLENKPYVILKISEARLLNSVNASNNAYNIIPLLNTDNTVFNQATTPVHGVIKFFNPPLGKLFWLDIEFVNYDGSLFNFRGQENMLMFQISQLNQPGKYNNFIERH
jgi:hypothetical protein